jgi:hypothetical protein
MESARASSAAKQELVKRKCRPAHNTILVTLPKYTSGHSDDHSQLN